MESLKTETKQSRISNTIQMDTETGKDFATECYTFLMMMSHTICILKKRTRYQSSPDWHYKFLVIEF